MKGDKNHKGPGLNFFGKHILDYFRMLGGTIPAKSENLKKQQMGRVVCVPSMWEFLMIYSFDKHFGQQQRDSMGEFLKILNQEFHMHWQVPSGDFLGDFYTTFHCNIFFV